MYRSIRSHPLWDDKPFTRGQAWVDLLLMASYEDRSIMFNGQYIKLSEGDIITSMNKLSELWGWSRGKVERYLKALKSDSMIDYQTDKHKTVIKVLNFNKYQTSSNEKRATNEQQTSNRRTTGEQQTNTYNNSNNYNNNYNKPPQLNIKRVNITDE